MGLGDEELAKEGMEVMVTLVGCQWSGGQCRVRIGGNEKKDERHKAWTTVKMRGAVPACVLVGTIHWGGKQ